MTAAANSPSDENALIRRMRRARLRQWAIAVGSVSAAAFGVAFLSPDSIGTFSYYTLSALLLLNATIALRQGMHVLFPIETLLWKIRRIEHAVDANKLDPGHFSIHSDDAFACLTAGIDALVSKLTEKLRAANERALLDDAMLQAFPFTSFTVSRAGKVYSVIRDEYDLVPLLGIEVGRGPTRDAWGEANAARFLHEVRKSFDGDAFRWFDLEVGAHHLRCSAKRLNDMTALVVLGDLPSIDKIVENMNGASSESDFSHRQNALKRFAASLAHDGRNVFAALGNLVEANKSSTDPAVREQVPLAEDSIRRGTKLMTELMQYAGETRYRLRTVPAAEACRELCSSPTLLATVPNNVTLLTDVSDKPMPQIDIDSDQLWKVLFNFVKNAVEAFGRSDGRIWLTAAPFEMTNEQSRTFRASCRPAVGSGVLLTVSDDGPGINPALLSRIFDPYVSSKGNGRGLGLATAFSVIDAHNGAVRVNSTERLGTSFEIFLPASRHSEEELQAIHEIAPNGEILLVDDDPVILRTTRLVLQSLKIAAHPASNEADALRKLRTLGTRLRAVLADADLGGTTSANLIRRIRETNPDLPVILTSGGDEDAVRGSFDGVPYDRFVAKPYTVEELASALGKVEVGG